MNAIYLYPEDLGVSQFAPLWKKLCERFGYPFDSPPAGLLLTDIKTNQ